MKKGMRERVSGDDMSVNGPVVKSGRLRSKSH